CPFDLNLRVGCRQPLIVKRFGAGSHNRSPRDAALKLAAEVVARTPPWRCQRAVLPNAAAKVSPPLASRKTGGLPVSSSVLFRGEPMNPFVTAIQARNYRDWLICQDS